MNSDYKTKDKTVVSVLVNDKAPRRRLKVGDPDFVPPDGGWGWFVVFACGFSNLSTFPVYQQFGLIFRDKFNALGITETQTTFITNLTGSFNAIVGLTNGPVYRNFTYRQVSLVFSFLVAASLFVCVFCSSFWEYVLFFCVFYGSSFGFVQSANAIALNTYFKEKRRIATGFSWTTTALGPILWPYIIVSLENSFGMDGVLMLFAGFSLHSFVCALLLQPVEWHTKFRDDVNQATGKDYQKSQTPQDTGKLSRISSILFANVYFGNEDDPVKTSYEIIDPGTPMMLRSNDGWYSQARSQVGSRLSLSSNKLKHQSGSNSEVVSKRPSYTNLSDYGQDREKRKKGRKISVQEGRIIKEIAETVHEDKELTVTDNNLKVPNEKDVLKFAAKKLALIEHEQHEEEIEKQKLRLEEQERMNLSLWQKIIIFFDFGLLRDLVYVNLMVGITIANFAELNFSLLTPIIMSEFNFTKLEIATFMSLLGATDIVVRFVIPFVADKIGWSNRSFFLIGVLTMAIGRIILIHFQHFPVALFVAVVIGAGKALRTIFMALIIPSHVSIEKLPAASGIQLAFCGISYVILGPIVGGIRDLVGNYVITLHLLNLCTYVTAISWILEMYIVNCKKNKDLLKKNGSIH